MSALKPSSRLSLTAKRKALAEIAAADACRAFSSPEEPKTWKGLSPITITNLDSLLRSADGKRPAGCVSTAGRGPLDTCAAKTPKPAELAPMALPLLPPLPPRAGLSPQRHTQTDVSGMQRGATLSDRAEAALQCSTAALPVLAPAAWTAGLADDGQPANFDCLGDFDFLGEVEPCAPPQPAKLCSGSDSAGALSVQPSLDFASAPAMQLVQPSGPLAAAAAAAASVSPHASVSGGSESHLLRRILLPPVPQCAASASGSSGGVFRLQAADALEHATPASQPVELQPRHQQEGPAGGRAQGTSRFAAQETCQNEPSLASHAEFRSQLEQSEKPAQPAVPPEAGHRLPHRGSQQGLGDAGGTAEERRTWSQGQNLSRSPNPWLTKACNAEKGLPRDLDSQSASRRTKGLDTPDPQCGASASRFAKIGGGGGTPEPGSSARRSHGRVERLYLAAEEAANTHGGQSVADEDAEDAQLLESWQLLPLRSAQALPLPNSQQLPRSSICARDGALAVSDTLSDILSGADPHAAAAEPLPAPLTHKRLRRPGGTLPREWPDAATLRQELLPPAPMHTSNIPSVSYCAAQWDDGASDSPAQLRQSGKGRIAGNPFVSASRRAHQKPVTMLRREEEDEVPLDTLRSFLHSAPVVEPFSRRAAAGAGALSNASNPRASAGGSGAGKGGADSWERDDDGSYVDGVAGWEDSSSGGGASRDIGWEHGWGRSRVATAQGRRPSEHSCGSQPVSASRQCGDSAALPGRSIGQRPKPVEAAAAAAASRARPPPANHHVIVIDDDDEDCDFQEPWKSRRTGKDETSEWCAAAGAQPSRVGGAAAAACYAEPAASEGQPWWMLLPDFVPVVALQNGRNPRDDTLVHVKYAQQFCEVAGSKARRAAPGKAQATGGFEVSTGRWFTENGDRIYLDKNGKKLRGKQAFDTAEREMCGGTKRKAPRSKSRARKGGGQGKRSK